MTRAALLYARQSITKPGDDDDPDDSLSLVSQIATLRDRCQREGWAVTGEITEAGLRGWMDTDERDGLAEALRRAEARDYNTLLIWDMSRLARSVRLQEHWVWQFARYGVDVVSHTEPHAGDALIRQVLGAVAEHRTREISSAVRRALHERARQGKPHGRAPWGYVRDAESGRYIPDSETALDVVHFFDLCASGLGTRLIADALTRQGIPTPRGYQGWRKQTVAYVRANPVYRGAIDVGGTLVPDAHPALISAEVWEAANREPPRQRAPRRKARVSWLEGLIEHGCGYPMYLVRADERMAFRCRASSRGILWSGSGACALSPREVLQCRAEALVWDALAADLASLSSLSRIVAAAKRRYRDHAPASVAARRDALERKKRASERRKRAEGLYLSGARDRPWFDAEDTVAAVEIAEAEAALANLPALPDEVLIGAAYDRVRSLGEALPHLDDDGRRSVLAALGVAVIESGGASFSRGYGGQARIRYHAEYAALFAARDT